jgi:hypothetical protein
MRRAKLGMPHATVSVREVCLVPKQWAVGGLVLAWVAVACGDNFDGLFPAPDPHAVTCGSSSSCTATCSNGSTGCACSGTANSCATDCTTGTCDVLCGLTTGCSLACKQTGTCRLHCPLASSPNDCQVTCGDGVVHPGLPCHDRGGLAFDCSRPTLPCGD